MRDPTRPTAARPPQRGAALLLVIVALAVITALAATVAYDTRVSLQIAANGRDELRAEYLAKSAVNLSRLVLSFQDRLNRVGAGTGAAGAQQAASTAVPQLWSVVPVNSGLLAALFGAGAEGAPTPPSADGKAKVVHRFGDFDGAFDAKIENEASKVNVNLDSSYTSGLRGAQYLALVNLVEDRRWDFLFDREDGNGNRVSRADLPVYLYDWVDENNVTSALTGNASNPFEDGSGDENQPYDRGTDRYRAKNAHFDSLDELYLVAGVSDAFMAAFGDQLTVYLPKDEPMALPCEDPRALVRYATLLASPPGQPILSDPDFPARLALAVRDATSGCLLALTPAQFGLILSTQGVAVNQTSTASTAANPVFTNKATVFRVRATGSAGDVTRTVDAIVSFHPKQAAGLLDQAQAQQTGIAAALGNASLGRIMHWKEE